MGMLPHHWSCQCVACKPPTSDAPIGVVWWLVNGAALVRAASWYKAREVARAEGVEPESLEQWDPTVRRYTADDLFGVPKTDE